MVVRILQIYSWVSWSQIMTHEPCDPSYVYDNFEKTVDHFFYKNTVTTIKSWIARRSNSNKSFAVLTLKASPYLSDGGGWHESTMFSREWSGRPSRGGRLGEDLNVAIES